MLATVDLLRRGHRIGNSVVAVAFTLAATLLAGSMGAVAQAPAKRAITLDDLGKIGRVGSPVISADGQWLIYSVSHPDFKEDKGHSDLWIERWDGSDNRQITFGKEGASHPEFSPDGKYISFLSSRTGPAKGNQVWLMSRSGGEPEQFTAIKDYELEDYTWSPDSKRLLLTLQPKDEPDAEDGKPVPPKPIVIDRYHFKQDVEGYLRDDERSALYLYDIEAKKFDKLTIDKNVDEEDAVWSPDGQSIAFVSNHDADPDRTYNSDVFVAAAKAGSTAKKLTAWDGQDGGHLAWSPDGKSIAYTQGAGAALALYSQGKAAVVTLDGKVTYPAAKYDRAMNQPCWLPDGKLLYLASDDRSEYPAEVEQNGDSAQRLLAEPGAAMGMVCKGDHIALLHSDDTHMPELFALEGHSLRQLTSVNAKLEAELNLASTQDITSKSKDGTEVHGLLTTPLGYKPGEKVPMILFIHGGPNGQDAHSFSFDRQWFVANGYAFLNVNYRGSAGRGQDYAKAIFADWGHLEVMDLLGAVDQVVSMGVADPNKLGIGGWSYGGILTDYTTASTDRFKGASSGAGMAAPLSFFGVDEYIKQYAYELGVPWKNKDLYIKLSYPLLEADKRMHTPTLYMGGTSDFNVPLVGGEQMYQTLRALNVPTELIVYPGQFHGFTRPSFIRDRYERWMAWYDHYVKGLNVPATPAPKPAAKPEEKKQTGQ
ncbi:S9 family peptidase [Acidicapsa dinghuensis]|uniref:Acyl-peptide hydrolase n=1 Tax=Acidicapsa dinghuensis TaxID=2218256 RepID=A0ABW1EBZ9_9BACT|nr:S9 family peptidase [Acidicapsa dinghuensis]